MNPLQENSHIPAPENEETQEPPPGLADAPARQSYYIVPRYAGKWRPGISSGCCDNEGVASRSHSFQAWPSGSKSRGWSDYGIFGTLPLSPPSCRQELRCGFLLHDHADVSGRISNQWPGGETKLQFLPKTSAAPVPWHSWRLVPRVPEAGGSPLSHSGFNQDE